MKGFLIIAIILWSSASIVGQSDFYDWKWELIYGQREVRTDISDADRTNPCCLRAMVDNVSYPQSSVFGTAVTFYFSDDMGIRMEAGRRYRAVTIDGTILLAGSITPADYLMTEEVDTRYLALGHVFRFDVWDRLNIVIVNMLAGDHNRTPQVNPVLNTRSLIGSFYHRTGLELDIIDQLSIGTFFSFEEIFGSFTAVDDIDVRSIGVELALGYHFDFKRQSEGR